MDPRICGSVVWGRFVFCSSRSCTFVDVKASASAPGAPATGGIYALTSSGVLVLMRAAGRTIDKSVNLQVSGNR